MDYRHLRKMSLADPVAVRSMVLTRQEAEFVKHIKTLKKPCHEKEVAEHFRISSEHALCVMRRLHTKGYLDRHRSNVPNERDGRDKWVYTAAI